MLFDLMTGGVQNAVLSILIVIPIVLMALTFHEFAHGYAAYKLGDPTAKMMGRLSLNPLKHLDLFGTIAILIAGIGWAKPVPVNSRYFKKPKYGMAITALAGPLMNLLLAFIGLTLFALYYRFASERVYNEGVALFFYFMGYLNCYLAVFNLLPVPPFDGSRLAFVILPDRLYWKVMQYERIIMLVVIVAILGLSRIGLNPFGIVADLIVDGIMNLYSMILL